MIQNNIEIDEPQSNDIDILSLDSEESDSTTNTPKLDDILIFYRFVFKIH